MRRMTEETAALVALLRRQDVAWPVVATEVEETGSALEVLRRSTAGQAQLFASESTEEELARARSLVLEWTSDGIDVVTVLDERYPANLAAVHQRPPLLFVHGLLDPDDTRAVAVVGTRRPSVAGVAFAGRVAAGLAERGLTVVSGLAAGIDTAAHRAALDRGGRTVAVIGTGVRRAYPVQNARLQEEIASRGLVLSQFWPDAPPTRHSFPMRNAVMSGYALATVVIEASERSGARMQARLALEHGRHVFLAAPLLQHDWAREHARLPNTAVIETVDDVLRGLDQLSPESTELAWA